MKTRAPRSKGKSVAMFLAVSVLCGLLLSGLAVPFVALASGFTKAASDNMQYLPAEFETPPQSEKSKILMADGSELATFFEENRTYVALEQISPLMQKAQIAIEDHRFYEHGAIDIQGLGRAIVRNLSGSTQGASTLTQQYVKLVQVETARDRGDEAGVQAAQAVSIERKIREMRYAMAVEERFSKNEILERYLNIAYYGDGAYGVEAAAHHYWNTTAKDLTLAQAAMLAGIVQNPVAFNPVKNPEKAIERRNQVLKRMASSEVGAITKEEADAAMQEGFDKSNLQTTPNGCTASQFPILCDYVVRTLTSDQMPSLGSTAEERTNRLKRGGLTIKTLIDPEAQQAAEAAVSQTVGAKDPVWGGSVLIQPSTGLITAMAQSRTKLGSGEGETWQNVNVSTQYGGIEGFQPGSTFKPFVIGAALEQGVPTSTTFDAPQTMQFKGQKFKNCEGTFTFQGSWEPKNYDKAYGVIDMLKAAQNSVNTYFIQLEAKVGICASIDMAQKLGVKLADGTDMRSMANYPSWVLGTAYVTPLSMAEAYATFANRGVHCNPIILQSVQAKDGTEIEIPSADCKKVIEPEVADGVNHVLSTVMTQGTGTRARMSDGRPQAGKTGTTDDAMSVWFAGYTPDMAGVSYIAVDNINPYYQNHRKSIDGMRLSTGTVLEGSGGKDAGGIWRAAMSAALKNVPHTSFEAPNQRVLEGEKVPIPSVAGMSYEQAKQTLEDAGFTTAKMEVFSPQPAGTYLGKISPSGSAAKFSTIRMQFSKGPQPTTAPTVGAPPVPSPGQPMPTTVPTGER